MTTPNLNAALAKVQAGLPVLERDRTVEITQKNGEKYGYSYVTLASLNAKILPLLAKNGLSFAAFPGAGADGKMALRYHLLHESGEQLEGEFPLSGEGGIQMIGGRITYARRYCLAAVVGVAAEEDDESHLSEDAPRTAQRAPAKQAASAPRPAAKTAQRAPRSTGPALPGEDPNGPVGADQHRAMRALWGELGMGGDDPQEREARLADVRAILNLEQLGSSTELTRGQAAQVIAALRERKPRALFPEGDDA